MKKPQSIDISGQYNNFNQVVKYVRSQAGFSAAAMSRATSVHRNSQTNYESLKGRLPGIEYLMSLSKLTQAPFWQLMAHRVQHSSKDNLIEHALDGMNASFFAALQHPGRNSGSSQALFDACQQLLDIHQRNENVALYRQHGDSMAPTLNDGDSLLIDSDDKTLREGQIFFVKIAEVSIARRFQHLPDGGIMMICDNPQFKPDKIEAGEVKNIEIIGKLVTSISHYR